MSLPGDENPNPQWQRPKGGWEQPQWQSGSPLGDDAEAPAEQPEQQWQHAPQWQQAPQSQQPPGAGPVPGWVAPPRTPGQAYAALILGIVGLVVCPLLPSIAALILGYQAKGEIDGAGGQLGGRGIAIAGIVLGWAAVVVYGLLTVLIIIGASAS
ncbi:DUF4190 domain-containing protein [Solirubrobacter ginsenosidimutans]|uniref:DUF4190 domain-containing protein n=1 Tax=Solirubrobacter ginsenosidimutans TaxID=490573 RepID=A0A9X3MTS5_9ACTN|nr:DUF4190 domain-containing protein [Solirubrobacter ginsenosidimutans]MDA0162459.1 DUF4190 domain-containing protein [Solirubrobacter ginsenosidimutans]